MQFKHYIQEQAQRGRHVVFAFGRMNPPTTGHKQLVDKVRQRARELGAQHEIVLSHSHDSSKNPLTPEQKLTHARRFFPRTNIVMATREQPSLLHHLSRLHAAGHEHVTVVAGSDRTQEYEQLINKYNGKPGAHGHFKFASVRVESSGERDPDSAGVSGMSASRMRAHAENNDFAKFKQGVPGHVSDEHARELFNHVRAGMARKEKRSLRERYLNGEVFNLGEYVQVNSGCGEIVYRGATYVTLEHGTGNTSKHWITEISDSFAGAMPAQVRVTRTARIPALLMNKLQLEEMAAAPAQISYLGYTTQNFDMCLSAQTHMQRLIAAADRNPKYLLQVIRALDAMFGIEKEAERSGFADPDSTHAFAEKYGVAHETLRLLGTAPAEMAYMQQHLQRMGELALHRDNTWANEYGTHVGQPAEMEEGTDSADYRLIRTVGADGRVRNRRIRAQRVITDPADSTTESVRSFRSFRNQFAVNEQDNPEHAVMVDSGLHAPMHDQGYENQPLGPIGLRRKTSGQAQQLLAIKRQLAQTPSPAYELMRRARLQDD